MIVESKVKQSSLSLAVADPVLVRPPMLFLKRLSTSFVLFLVLSMALSIGTLAIVGGVLFQ
jgi:hypothetical protein